MGSRNPANSTGTRIDGPDQAPAERRVRANRSMTVTGGQVGGGFIDPRVLTVISEGDEFPGGHWIVRAHPDCFTEG
jgi:hypothetical protein